MPDGFSIKDGAFKVVRNGIERFNSAHAHMVSLSRVTGTHAEPQRNGSRAPKINNNISLDQTVTIASCHPKATHLIGRITITLGAGESYNPSIPPGKPYTFMGGTFVFAHTYDWYAGYTIFLDGAGNVKLHRRIVSSYAAPDTGWIYFNLRAFTIDYRLRAVRFI